MIDDLAAAGGKRVDVFLIEHFADCERAQPKPVRFCKLECVPREGQHVLYGRIVDMTEDQKITHRLSLQAH